MMIRGLVKGVLMLVFAALLSWGVGRILELRASLPAEAGAYSPPDHPPSRWTF